MAEDETGRNTPVAEDARIQSLEKRLQAARRAEEDRAAKRNKGPAKGYSQGHRILAELIGAPLGGGLIGWVLDRWLDTSPIFLLVLVFLGFAVAFRNIYRISKEPPR
ncbi:MAG: AtpZ/AtpI family protein [Parasphingopyxis sp.]|uniref:AtpZ/AtpI family protein n=1 Tax=Parasphingopyxis sp. TaxID=1920299 RepID=UPI002628AEAB|nr:AtpZ/AtpI family protein [uncultured Parasphingopyxis sp.]